MAADPRVPAIQVHLCVKGGDAAIAFYEAAFGASCTFRLPAEDGKRLLHAALSLNGGEFMLNDEFPEYSAHVMAPTSRGGATMTVNLNLADPTDVDAAVARAETAGAVVVMPAADMFWGARYAQVRDPFGHVWALNAPIPKTSEPA